MKREVNFGRMFLLAVFLAGLCHSALGAKKKPPANPIDLNAATLEQLEQLPGIGPVTAKAIVRFREKSGPFERVEDLLAIRGISEGKLKRLRPYVAVNPRKPAKGREALPEKRHGAKSPNPAGRSSVRKPGGKLAPA